MMPRRRLPLVFPLLLAALVATPCVRVQAQALRTPVPVIEPAQAGTTCVADPATMRRSHMDMLKHQRDDTVQGGVRNGAASLKACINCHASPQSRSVAHQDTNFCISCHSYAAVKIDCFECHSSKATDMAKAVAAVSAPVGKK